MKKNEQLSKLYLQRISNILLINGRFSDNPGLSPGEMGLVLFFFRYARFTQNEIYSDYSFETCRETGTFIRVSRYPVSLDFSALEEKARTAGVALFPEPGQTAKSFRKDVYDLSGGQDEQLSHSMCQLFGSCCQLNRGKFYPCTISANFHHFNRYFNLGLSLSGDNYIDIYKTRSKKEFYRLITTPIPCCRYCNMYAREFGVKWDRSKKQISEWTLNTG